MDNTQEAKPEQLKTSGDEANQDNFEKTQHPILETFMEGCKEHELRIGICIIVDPKTNRPEVIVKGHSYDAAALLAGLLRDMKSELIANLETEPLFLPPSGPPPQ